MSKRVQTYNKRIIWNCIKIIEHTMDIMDNTWEEDPNWTTDKIQVELETLKKFIKCKKKK